MSVAAGAEKKLGYVRQKRQEQETANLFNSGQAKITVGEARGIISKKISEQKKSTDSGKAKPAPEPNLRRRNATKRNAGEWEIPNEQTTPKTTEASNRRKAGIWNTPKLESSSGSKTSDTTQAEDIPPPVPPRSKKAYKYRDADGDRVTVSLSQPPHKILNVQEFERDKKVIAQAYRNAAKNAHPDKHPDDPKAKDKFQDIVHAYHFLLWKAGKAGKAGKRV